MSRTSFACLLAIVFTLLAPPGAAEGESVLDDYGLNVDGSVVLPFFDPVPSSVDRSAFDETTGLGTVSVTLAGAGPHHVAMYIDLRIGVSFFDERVATAGHPHQFQSWEADEPGLAEPPVYRGDGYEHFFAGTPVAGSALDNTVYGNGSVDLSAGAEDAALMLAWDFTLAEAETATVSFLTTAARAGDRFTLVQFDPHSDQRLFFSSHLTRNLDGPLPDRAGQGRGGIIAFALLLLAFCLAVACYRLYYRSG